MGSVHTVWTLYSEDDGVVVFATKQEAEQTRERWCEAGANGVSDVGECTVEFPRADDRVSADLEITDIECSDIITTAVEGGGPYWANFRKYKTAREDAVTVEVREIYGKDWHVVNAAVIRRGIAVCAHKYPHVFAQWLRDRCGDASNADVILQCGVFGQAIYG